MKKSYLKSSIVKKTLIIITVIISSILALNASDRTDALALQNQCDAESKILEVPVRNFGDENDIKNFEEGIKTIKLGKIKVAQSKYRDAIALFNEYIKTQYNIYKSLADKYIKRTDMINDDSAIKLVDFVDNQQILRNFESAFQYLTNGKNYYTSKHYNKVIGLCRMAKKKIFENFKIAGLELPEEYKKDMEDIGNKISQ